MNKLLLLSLLCFNSIAMAQGSVEETASLSSRWSGPYLGINAGFASAHSDYPSNGRYLGVGYEATGSGSSSGVIGGFQAGYNWQLAPNILLGLEADYNFTDIRNTADVSSSQTAAIGIPAFNVESRLNGLGTVRARLGYVNDNMLFYATGGFAYGTQDVTINSNSAGSSGTFVGSGSQQLTGWTLGAGIEYQLTKEFLLRAEYLYMDFGTTSIYTRTGSSLRSLSAQMSDQPRVNQFRVGLSYLW